MKTRLVLIALLGLMLCGCSRKGTPLLRYKFRHNAG